MAFIVCQIFWCFIWLIFDSIVYLFVFFVIVSSFSLNVILGLWFYFPPFADGIFLSVALAFFYINLQTITVLFLPFDYLHFFIYVLVYFTSRTSSPFPNKSGDNRHPHLVTYSDRKHSVFHHEE